MNIFEEGFKFNPSVVVEWIITGGLKILLLLIAFAIVKPLGKKAIGAAMKRMSNQRKLSDGRSQTLEKLAINIFSYSLTFIFIVMLLSALTIEIGPLLAGAGIVGLAIGFGAQGLVSDIVTGFFLLSERQVEVGDYVTAGGYDGVVEEVGIRTTLLRSFDGTLNFIPNRNISGVANHSRGNMRALVDIGIGYDENIDQAMTVLKEVADEFANDERFKEGPSVLGVQNLGSSDVVIRILGKTENMEQWAVERDLRKAMKEALDQAGIEIPYPHQVNVTKKEND
ncbi:mechanosensitive ion channel protein [Halobacillus halophilus]|uniref:Small-conductance mechanosensitive channel n=1 Tax=Halobacillus halophilus (strain ATCC 35676 / DSM 2266 / JCM 20832 / KCTC 3685 / LMG 17431 / NBRC 102448 / NCIMB 2269) TaxID=866895 RepID=I0JLX2_HALH3|nr:mechanosensitive ion channel family protein [Halobacillus halophilus]ASF39241.1 mechanosensitive ion channel protein [Halobacillus halophilus]CCG45142.1 small-conductance mechanosensitive channel [Halobacillus halophilus DSM 2266]